MPELVVPPFCCRAGFITFLGLLPRVGNKLLIIEVVCPQNGTAVLKELIHF